MQNESDAKNLVDKECKKRECLKSMHYPAAVDLIAFLMRRVCRAGSATVDDIRKQNDLLKSLMQEGEDGKKRFNAKIPMEMFLEQK